MLKAVRYNGKGGGECLCMCVCVCVGAGGIKTNNRGLLTGDMLVVDEFQFSTNDQLLYEVKNKGELPNTGYIRTDILHLAPSTHTKSHTLLLYPYAQFLDYDL